MCICLLWLWPCLVRFPQILRCSGCLVPYNSEINLFLMQVYSFSVWFIINRKKPEIFILRHMITFEGKYNFLYSSHGSLQQSDLVFSFCSLSCIQKVFGCIMFFSGKTSKQTNRNSVGVRERMLFLWLCCGRFTISSLIYKQTLAALHMLQCSGRFEELK